MKAARRRRRAPLGPARRLRAPRGAGEPRASLTLTDAQARTLGAVLGGAYFKPAVVEEIEAVIGGLLIDWVTLRDDSPARAARSPSSRSGAARG